MITRRVTATRHGLIHAAVCMLIVVVARALLSLLLLRHGFCALSDDDYSRVVIAQRFAEEPSWDPSHTSWLPFPFWLYGTCMAGFGGSLAIARGIGFAVGLGSSALVWFAGRVLGISRSASLLGALIALANPYSALLGLATTPDVYSAALILFSCATLARKSASLRLLGALALGAASLSRYEAWPVAVLWALFNGVDAVRYRRWNHVWLALLGLTPPALWMLHGQAIHDSALFFIERVASYQHALGSSAPNTPAQILRTPWRLFADAPEIWALLLVASIRRGPKLWRRRWLRPLCAVSGTVLLVWIADLHGSTATHHASRTLLAFWFMLAAIAAASLSRRGRRAIGCQRLRLVVESVGAVAVSTAVLRPIISSMEPPQDRSQEVRFGLLASAQLPQGARLAIATRDYGYFAVQAAFARPESTRIINEHDPRRPTEQRFRSVDEARRTLQALQADWIVADREHEPILSQFAAILERDSSLLIAKAR